MKKYNCPDCKLDVNDCYGCPRLGESVSNVPDNLSFPEFPDTIKYPIDDFPPYTIKYPIDDMAPNYEVCENCLNNPKNGGSGICNCALPYMSRDGKGKTFITTNKTITLDGESPTYSSTSVPIKNNKENC